MMFLYTGVAGVVLGCVIAALVLQRWRRHEEEAVRKRLQRIAQAADRDLPKDVA